jgi:hypothetical protein
VESNNVKHERLQRKAAWLVFENFTTTATASSTTVIATTCSKHYRRLVADIFASISYYMLIPCDLLPLPCINQEELDAGMFQRMGHLNEGHHVQSKQLA